MEMEQQAASERPKWQNPVVLVVGGLVAFLVGRVMADQVGGPAMVLFGLLTLGGLVAVVAGLVIGIRGRVEARKGR